MFVLPLVILPVVGFLEKGTNCSFVRFAFLPGAKLPLIPFPPPTKGKTSLRNKLIPRLVLLPNCHLPQRFALWEAPWPWILDPAGSSGKINQDIELWIICQTNSKEPPYYTLPKLNINNLRETFLLSSSNWVYNMLLLEIFLWLSWVAARRHFDVDWKAKPLIMIDPDKLWLMHCTVKS